MMLLNDKIYIRCSAWQPSPFKAFSKQTLEEIKPQNSPKYDWKLQWTKEDEHGRSLEATPLITDGSQVYVLA
jgi:hypothetical protein